MNVRDLIVELERLARDHGEDCDVKLYLSIEGQLLDKFTVSYHDKKEIHINSSDLMDILIL